MKQFFGAFFGSLIGLIVATIIGIFVIVGIIRSTVNSALKENQSETALVKANSVLHLEMSGELFDRAVDDPFEGLGKFGSFGKPEGYGINLLIKKIKSAKEDDKIKGIYLEMKMLGGGYANLKELRDILADFKKSGKFIYSYGEYYGQKEYYLASIADKIFLNPEGILDFKGLNMSLMFFKNTFEKLGVEMQIFRHGKFKSAIEPFMLDKMSQANRLQSEVFLGSIWNTMLQGISEQRKISTDELNKMANDLAIQSAEDAAKFKMVDAIAYEDEVMEEIRKKAGLEANAKIPLVSFSKYHAKNLSDVSSKNKIAVVYAVGAIYSGEGDDTEIGSDRIAKALREARLDDNVKAIVFRVNSPGGSALASDVIWREVKLAKAAKPVIVSMGTYAASGGYYISCAATRIFAQPNTITGSIGVFGVLPNIQKALHDKLGISVDTVNTNEYSSLGNTAMPVREKEREYIQSSIERIYGTFTSKVAEGRNMKQADVDSIGQGRVWTGADAQKIGLVDETGGLYDAIQYAVKVAKVDKYKLIELPRPKNKLEILFGKAEDDAESRFMKKNLGKTYVYLKQVQQLTELKGVQARLPFEMVIE